MATASPSNTPDTPVVGIFTRTIVRSPVVRWIVPARLRHRSLNDVVLVGDDFIQVKQVTKHGQLEHVYTHDHFDSRICAASAFDIDRDIPKEDDFLHNDSSSAGFSRPVLPSQLLVLTLEAQTLQFAYLETLSSGRHLLRLEAVKLPRWPEARLQLCQHLAVDPHSRALAVAAMEQHLYAFSTKSSAQTRTDIEQKRPSWCPVLLKQPVTIQGIVQHITFLNPSRADSEHIILLVVVVERRRTRLVWYDWWYSGNIQQMQAHDTLVLDSPRTVPHLVIPLARANFALVHDDTISICKNLLSGSVLQVQKQSIDAECPPDDPGIAPRKPLWANWCRPMRHASTSADRDFFYLAREDGKVFLLEIEDTNLLSSFAGDLQCFVGRALASLGNDLDPDLLAVAGDMSTGQIASIGDWPQLMLHQESRAAALSMDLVELLPNWASVTDAVVTSTAASKHQRRSQDDLLVSSGRQPHASLTEIRKGLEARIAVYNPLDDARGVNAIWALQDPSNGDVVFLLSTPGSTIVLCLSAQTDTLDVASTSAFQTKFPTLAADIIPHGYIVQVTSEAVTVTTSLHPRFDDNHHQAIAAEGSILCAAIEPEAGLVLCAEAHDELFLLTPYFLDNDDMVAGFLAKADNLPSGLPTSCGTRLLAVATIYAFDDTFVAAVTDTGTLSMYLCQDRALRKLVSYRLYQKADERCESVAIIASEMKDHPERGRTGNRGWLKIICGLRSGDCLCFTVDPDHMDPPLHQQAFKLGQEPVTLVRHSSQKSDVVALTGVETCLLSIDHDNMTELRINSIWLTDKARPDLTQSRMCGYTIMPPADKLPKSRVLGSLGGQVVLLSGQDLNFAELYQHATTVPRQIPIRGSPNRILYAHWHRCWVTACTWSTARTINNGEYRQVFPVIDFISVRDTTKFKSFTLQPGDEVYALLEWTHRTAENKLHSFVLVGGLHDVSRQAHGKIDFLRPDMHNEDSEVHASRPLVFDAPVYALALYDELTFVACYGSKVAVFRFDAENRRWQQMCPALALSSRGVAVSCVAPCIYITTASDGMLIVELTESSDRSRESVHTLLPQAASSSAAIGLAHVVTHCSTGSMSRLLLMSTKVRRIVGLASTGSVTTTRRNLGPVALRSVFEAELKQSVVRLRKGNIRPSWKTQLPAGVLVGDVIGICADGSVLGLLVLDEQLWRRLFWLQRLVEWNSSSDDTSALYKAGDSDVLGSSRELPAGLARDGSSIVLLSPHNHGNKALDRHIDGDALAVILANGGAEAVQSMITKVSERGDDIGLWLREHIEAERAAVDECVADLKVMLEAWM